MEYNELRSPYDSLEDEKIKVDDIINAFKERHSNEEIKEDLDSNGILTGALQLQATTVM